MDTLGDLPDRVQVRTKSFGESVVVVLFVTRLAKLQTGFKSAMKLLPPDGGMLWVSWPKRASKMETDLDEDVIRGVGLEEGMVDTKVCAVDDTWSGLRFSRRRT